MIPAGRVSGIVLAAGLSSRFGSPKLLAPFRGRPLLQHVLDAAAGFGLREVVVVLAPGGHTERAVTWRSERRVVNPRPEDGLSSSLRLGIGAVSSDADAAVILLGDQPLVRAEVVEALLAAADPHGPPLVVPRYDGDDAPNPVLVLRPAFGLAGEATGDRGLGPVLRAQPDLVLEVPVAGSNPDVDTPADLAGLDPQGGPETERP